MFPAHVVLRADETSQGQPSSSQLVCAEESDDLEQLRNECREASKSDDSTHTTSSSPMSNTSNWSKDSAIHRAQ